jgi:hypothetical protein
LAQLAAYLRNGLGGKPPPTFAGSRGLVVGESGVDGIDVVMGIQQAVAQVGTRPVCGN